MIANDNQQAHSKTSVDSAGQSSALTAPSPSKTPGILSGGNISSNYGEFSGLRTPSGGSIGGGILSPAAPGVSNSAVLSAGLGAAQKGQSATPLADHSTINDPAAKVRISAGNTSIQSSPASDKSGVSLQPPGEPKK